MHLVANISVFFVLPDGRKEVCVSCGIERIGVERIVRVSGNWKRLPAPFGFCNLQLILNGQTFDCIEFISTDEVLSKQIL